MTRARPLIEGGFAPLAAFAESKSDSPSSLSHATLSIVGFPLGCTEQDWLAYGTGIHAISGQSPSLARSLSTPSIRPTRFPSALKGMNATFLVIFFLIHIVVTNTYHYIL